MRGRKGLRGTVDYRAIEPFTSGWSSVGVPLDPTLDYTGVVTLAFNAASRLQVVLGVVDEKSPAGTSTATLGCGEVRRAKEEGEPIAFIVGSCRHRGYGMLRRGQLAMRDIRLHLAAKPADFLLLCGDQVYCDLPIKDEGWLPPWPRRVAPRGEDEYFQHYRLAFAEQAFREALREIPVYTTFDDHEVENNWGGYKYPAGAHDHPMAWGLRAYLAYQASHGPAPLSYEPSTRQWCYEFSQGIADFLVLDTRTEREDPRSSGAGMISDEQVRAIEQFVTRDDSRIKFIVSAVPIAPDTYARKERWASDTWRSYPVQRREILDFIVDHAPMIPIFIGGDLHLSTVVGIRHGGLSIPSIVSSALNWWTFGIQKRGGILGRFIEFLMHGPLLGAEHDDVDGRGYTVVEEVKPVHGNNFVRIDVSSEAVSISIIESGYFGASVTREHRIEVESLRNPGASR